MIFIILPLSGLAREKFIKLRNETIATKKVAASNNAKVAANEQNGLWIVQFEDGFRANWLEEVKKLGIEVHRSVPEDAYLVSITKGNHSGLRKLPFVRWVGRYKPEHKVHQGLRGEEEERNVRILFKPGLKAEERLKALGKSLKLKKGSAGSYGIIYEGKLTKKELDALAQSETVLWIEPAPRPKLFDAKSSQIVAGEVAAGNSTLIHDLGFTGEGVTVAVADSGLMTGEPSGMHPDLAGRVPAFFYYGELTDASDEHSHGTHVAGIIAGDGATGEVDEEGYLYGLGIAPKANIVAQRIFDGIGGYHPPTSFAEMTRDAMESGAEIGSNSWGEDNQGRYDLFAMEFDALVRDGNNTIPGDQPYILEFSAGNAGPGFRTIGTPAVAKNVIATGASQNNRPEFLFYAEGQDAMADFSSRGPCEDGRIKPDVVAPGTWIASLQSSFATDENAWMPISQYYLFQGGTSQSGPQVSGAAAIFVQYYRQINNGATPSPALVKAALINSAVDMDDFSGTRPIPNNDEGWGRVDLAQLINSDLTYEFVDQEALLQNVQSFEKSIVVLDANQPLKVTLTYTDVPGFPGAIPALINDLDLEVISPSGIIYRGNQFIAGESAGNAPGTDKINNVEGVHLFNPEQGEYTVRVSGAAILQDARSDSAALDQDFALAISGSIPVPGAAVLFAERRAYTIPSTLQVRLIDFDQSAASTVEISLRSSSEPTPFTINLNSAGPGIFTGAVAIVSGTPTSDNILQSSHGDTINMEYFDISSGITVTSTVQVDSAPPIISGIFTTNRFGTSNIEWNTDEPARGIVELGTTTALGLSFSNLSLRTSQLVSIPELVPGETYYFRIIAQDAAGNLATNDNNGVLHSFVASGVPPVLLVDAYVHTPDSSAEFIPLTEYTDALDAIGMAYEIWSVEENDSPPLDILRPYKAVIWRINDSFWESTTISGEEQAVITEYVQGGGSFFMASMEIISRLGPGPFRENILQVAEFVTNPDPFSECPDCDEDHGVESITGGIDDPLMQGLDITLDYSMFPFEDFGIFAIGPDLSDTFGAGTNAISIFAEDTGRNVGIRSPRFAAGEQGRVVFLSFPLETIPSNDRPGVLERAFNFLIPGLSGAADLALDNSVYTLPSLVNIELGDSDLAGEGDITVLAASDTNPAGISVTLQESVRPGIFHGFFSLVATNTPQGDELIAAPTDNITVEYLDASAGGTVRVQGRIDTIKPIISAVEVEESYEDTLVYWNTDKLSDSLVQYGESRLLGKTAYRGTPSIDHEVLVNGLLPGKTYYFQVVSRDQAGNTTVDDNNGQLYTFTTLSPETTPYIEDFEGMTTGFWDVFSDEDFGSRSWELGTPNNLLADSANSGLAAWGTNLRDELFDDAHTFLISPAVYLEPGSTATLRFFHNYDFTGPATIETGQLLLFTNSQTQPLVLSAFDEFTFGWEEEVFDLTSHAGRVIQVVWEYWLFDLENTSEPKSGWLVDDVSITTTPITSGGTVIVTNNLSQASYQFGSFSGSGNYQVFTNVPAGNYTAVFQPVTHYHTPASEPFTVTAGSTITVSGNYTFTDDDQNSIADSWETQYPGAGDGDMDGDGATDYAEFMAGTVPNDPSSSLELLTPMPTGTNRVLLRWSSSPGHAYRVLRSLDAQSWIEESPWVRSSTGENSYTVTGLTNRATLFRVQVRP